MDKRQAELEDLQNYLLKVDKEVTMVLQSLQWDRKRLLEGEDLVTCSINANHRIPQKKKEEHENRCVIASQGYSSKDLMLPDPADSNSTTLVKFCKQDIKRIIEEAASTDPNFRKGVGHSDSKEPLSLSRLQTVYSSDERRAVYDAVIAAAPEHGDLNELCLLSAEERKRERVKSKQEILAELRDMKRRRTKYRVATKSKNYSDVLRDVIKSQMEVYTGETETNENRSVETKESNEDLRNIITETVSNDRYNNERHTDSHDKKRNDRRQRYSSKDTYRDDNDKWQKRDADYRSYSESKKYSSSSQDSKRYNLDNRHYKEGRNDKKYERKDYGNSSEVKVKIEPGTSTSRQERVNDKEHYSSKHKYKSERSRHDDSYDSHRRHREDKQKARNESKYDHSDRNVKEETPRRYYDQYENAEHTRKHKKHSKNKYRDK